MNVNFHHIEIIQATHINNTRIILGVDYENDLDARYAILQFKDARPETHNEDVLSKIYHEDSGYYSVVYHTDDTEALDLYIDYQRRILNKRLQDTGTLIDI